MIVQFWKSKLQTTLFFLFMIALLSQAPSANAQSASVDIPPNPAWGGRTGQIAGTVYLNRNGEPASKVLVNIRSMLSGVSHAAETDFDGHFALSEIPQGTYEVSASEQGYGFASTITEVGLFPAEINLYLSSSNGPARGANPYAVSLRELKIPSKAQKSLREALLRKPQYADVYLVLADVHAKRRDYQAQVQDLDIYLKLVPSAAGSDYVRKVREAAKRLISDPRAQN